MREIPDKSTECAHWDLTAHGPRRCSRISVENCSRVSLTYSPPTGRLPIPVNLGTFHSAGGLAVAFQLCKVAFGCVRTGSAAAITDMAGSRYLSRGVDLVGPTLRSLNEIRRFLSAACSTSLLSGCVNASRATL
jgi:hypothetical protein